MTNNDSENEQKREEEQAPTAAFPPLPPPPPPGTTPRPASVWAPNSVSGPGEAAPNNDRPIPESPQLPKRAQQPPVGPAPLTGGPHPGSMPPEPRAYPEQGAHFGGGQPNAPHYGAPAYGAPGYQQPYGMPQPPQGYPQPPEPQLEIVEPVLIAAVPDVSITTGFNYAWKRFRENIGTLFLVALTYVGIAFLLGLLIFGLMRAARGSAGVGFAVFILVIATVLYAAVAQANMLRGALLMVDGKPVEYATFFQFKHVGTVLLAGLIIGALSGVLFFTVVAPVVIMAATTFTFLLIIDKNYGAWDAIVGSAKIVWNNIATVVVFLIASFIANYVGTLFFGVGILFAVPVVLIAQAWLFKELIGESVDTSI